MTRHNEVPGWKREGKTISIRSFMQQIFVSTYSVLGSKLGSEHTVVNAIGTVSVLMGLVL